LIVPLGYNAKVRNDEFNQKYTSLLSKMQRDFLNSFCLEDGSIDWDKIVELNSKSNGWNIQILQKFDR
jgi:predicted DNA-binding protein YlxM (UPF0122 family)